MAELAIRRWVAVALTVLGMPPSQTVIPWEDATIAGFALTSPTARHRAKSSSVLRSTRA